jgi:hypothetical protein
MGEPYKPMTQNMILTDALVKLVKMCYSNKMQHSSSKMQTAMEEAELALKQPKIKVLPCPKHSQLETSTEDIDP